MRKIEILIVCVDRDDDVGRKAGIKGPVIGRNANLKMATALALADPQDADANTVFEAVRSYDTLSKDKRVEVVTVTGHQDVGARSDTIIDEQLGKVFKKTGAKKAILVSDGLQDEQVLPLIQKRAEVITVNRVVMKQSERLEGMYYMIHDFIENPKMSKIFLGFPALALLLIAIFGTAGWRLILGGLGLYLMIKGFKLEARLDVIYNEFADAFSKRHVSVVFYAASLFIGLIGLKGGYDFIRVVRTANTIETMAAFIHGSIFLLFLGFGIALIGRVLNSPRRKRQLPQYVTYASMGLAVAFVGYEASNVIIAPETGFLRLAGALLFGIFLIGASRALEKVV